MKVTQVALALIQKNGFIFLQQRTHHQTYSGYWEFPGGKIEADETPKQALDREVQEEVGINILTVTPWLVCRHSYPHGEIVLHLFRISEWEGEIGGKEGQAYCWQSVKSAPPSPFLPANKRIWKWLQLPSLCAITTLDEQKKETLLAKLPLIINKGFNLIQLRDKQLPTRKAFASAILKITRDKGALLVINDDENLAEEVGADGVHLSSQQLQQKMQRPDFEWVGASCHNEAEIKHAFHLGLDYVVLSPVLKTLTHVDTPPMGWEKFFNLRQHTEIPIYALGGLSTKNLSLALSYGAQGVAMMRQAWESD